MEETTFSADKSQNVLVTLREHLSVAFPNLSACVPMSQIRNDTTGNISMVMPLKSKSEPTGSSTKGYINMGLPLDTPTFMLQFTPMAIVTDEESPSPSSRSLLSVSLATYHGLVLKKDYLTFYINFNNPQNLDEAELRTSTCELLTRLESFPQGYRLCSGLSSPAGSLKIDSVFIEPFGENRDELVVLRSRKCEFMLEMEEMFGEDKIELDRTTCVQCGLLQNSAICLKMELFSNVDDEEDSDQENQKINVDDHIGTDDRVKDPNWEGTKKLMKLTEENAYSCNHCDRRFKTERALRRHEDQEVFDKTKCSKCKKKFNSTVILKSHEDKCSGVALSSDAPSKKRRKAASILVKKRSKKSRILNEKDPVQFDKTCPVCFRVFAMTTRFDQHMELHKRRIENLHTETSCQAEDCGEVFPDRILLIGHYRDFHNSEAAPCAYCLKIVKTGKMRSHFFTDHPTQQYVCQICNKMCPFLSQLKQHTKEVHSSEKSRDVVCEHCGNRYRREAGLRQHMASAHSDHREFQCLHCGKGFTTQTRLTQHVRIHTGAKPFKCKQCEYKSNRADNVLFHCRKVHKIQKPSRFDDVQIFEEQLVEDYKTYPIKMLSEIEVPSATIPSIIVSVNQLAA